MNLPQSVKPAVRVTRVKIEKFRAIGSAEIELGETIALVGQNGAGKSSVLRALNAFFDEFHLPEEQRNTHELLVGRGKAIKRQEILLAAIAGLPANALPTSYKTLRREIPRLAKQARSR